MQTKFFDDTIIYQIMPDRFHIGNGKTIHDKIKAGLYPKQAEPREWTVLPEGYPGAQYDFFGGDLKGITEKLEYIKELGANTIYITPFFPSETYHKYDAVDFRGIDKAFGNFEDFDELVNKLHALDMKIIVDIAINHLSDKHPYFVDAIRSINSKYKDYFYFTEYPTEYTSWWGHKHMPEINYTNKGAVEEFITGENSVINTWLKKNVDGIRFDCANDLGLEVVALIHQTIKKANPGTMVIGEIANFAPDFAGELDGVQSYFVTSSIFSLLNGKITASQFGKNIQRVYDEFGREKAARSYIMVSSHDFPRLLNSVENDLNKYHIALVLQFTLPGTPMIYYGEEIGMTGAKDPENRAAMIWDKTKWNMKSFEFYKKMIALRKSRPELNGGKFMDLSSWLDNGIIAYMRIGDEIEDYSLIIINPTGEEKSFEIYIPYSYIHAGIIMRDMWSDKSVTVEDSNFTLHIGAGEFSIYIPDYTHKQNFTFYKNCKKEGTK